MKDILVMGATAALLLLQAPKTTAEATVDMVIDLGAVTAIAEYIDRNGGDE